MARHPLATLRAAFPPLVAVLTLLAVCLQVGYAAMVLREGDPARPLRVPSLVVGPDVVSAPLARDINAMPQTPFAVTASSDVAGAERDVEAGRVEAVLVIDLATTHDQLLLTTGMDPRLQEAITSRVVALDKARGRSVEVRLLGHPDGNERRDHAHLLTMLACALGFLLAVGTSLRWGPVARSLRRGFRRMVGLAAASTAGGIVLGWLLSPGDPATRIGVGLMAAGVVTACAFVTTGIEALAGWAGLGLAVFFYFLTSLPLLTHTDPLLLADPWGRLAPLSIPVAGLQAISGVLVHDSWLPQPIMVLSTWSLIAYVAALIARWVRSRHGVPHPGTEAAVATAPLSPARSGAGSTRVDASPRTPGGQRKVVLWRLRVLALVTPLAVALFVAAVTVPHPTVAAPATLDSQALSSECIQTGEVRFVEDLNRVAALRGSPLFRGGDVGADVELQDGRRLLFFGDTLRDLSTGPQFVRNSMLAFSPDCIRLVLPPDKGAIIPNRPLRAGETQAIGYWPMSTFAVRHPGYDLVYVTTQRVRATGTGAFDFENLGTSVAIFSVPRNGTPQLIDRQDIGPDRVGRQHPTWGAATALTTEADGQWAYLYGTANPGSDKAWGYSLRVARVRPKDIMRQDRWTYWDGQRWQPDAARAVELIPAREGVSQTLSVFPSGGSWYAVSKRNDFLGSDITVWKATAPQGPFSGGESVAPIATKQGTGLLRYMPLAHPTLLPQEGTVVVSYSTNDNDPTKIKSNPLLYRPHFLRITLPR